MKRAIISVLLLILGCGALLTLTRNTVDAQTSAHSYIERYPMPQDGVVCYNLVLKYFDNGADQNNLSCVVVHPRTK